MLSQLHCPCSHMYLRIFLLPCVVQADSEKLKSYALEGTRTIIVPAAAADTDSSELHDKLTSIGTHPLFQSAHLQGASVKLDGWTLSEPVVQALRDLPAWQSTLDLSACDWPVNSDHAYQRLAGELTRQCALCTNEACVCAVCAYEVLPVSYHAHTCTHSVYDCCCAFPHMPVECIPTSYTAWVLPSSTSGLSPLLTEMCAVIDAARAGLGLPPLILARTMNELSSRLGWESSWGVGARMGGIVGFWQRDEDYYRSKYGLVISEHVLLKGGLVREHMAQQHADGKSSQEPFRKP